MDSLSLILVYLTAAVKFLLAPTLSLSLGYSTWTTVTVVFLGGVTGVCFFYLAADWLMENAAKRRRKKEDALRAQGKDVPKKKVFTSGRRRLIRVKNRFGLLGISIVTPCIISIPVGSILAARFFKNRVKVLTYMISSCLVWAFILTF
jgi:hypothetical protein